MQSQSTSLNILLAGETALSCLVGNGEVLAVMSHAIYLCSDQQEIFWISEEGTSMHRRALQVAPSLPEAKTGSHYNIREHCLMIDSEVKANFAHCQAWAASRIEPGTTIGLSELRNVVPLVFHHLSDWPLPAGLGRLIPGFLNASKYLPPEGETDLDSYFLKQTWSSVTRIIIACQKRDTNSLLEQAETMVGLGKGLTPAGDDFLGGLFFCLRLLQQYYPGETNFPNWNFSEFIQKSESQTNRISSTFLKDHSEGHSLEPLHCFFTELLSGQELARVLPQARALVEIGHSTGWDLLTGTLAGLCAVLPKN